MPRDEELEGQEASGRARPRGLRDRALLLVGLVAALRRSELAALSVDAIAEHPNGLVLSIPRSKTNQTGEQVELVVLPRARMPAHCRSRRYETGSMPPESLRAQSSGRSLRVTDRAPGP